MNMPNRNLIKGFKTFQRFLNQERANLAATPILLLDSDPSNSSPEKGQFSPLLRHVQMLFTSVGLRTAVSSPTSDHFPFVEEIPHTLEFAKRIGATTIVGVGGTSAIELAKTIPQENPTMEQLILVPGTCAATLLANASHSLLLDPQETLMLPKPANNTPLRQDPELPSHVVIPEKVLVQQDLTAIQAALYAGIVLTLDSLYRGVVDNPQEAISNIETAVQLLQEVHESPQLVTPDREAKLQDLLVWSGTNLSFGLAPTNGVTPRSIPLAVAASLVPTTFPDYKMVDFIAGLLPGMVAVLQDHPEYSDFANQLYHKLNSSCPRLSQSTGDELQINALLSQIHNNGAEWDCLDVNDRALEQVLHASLDL